MYSWILDTSNSPNSVLYLVYWLGCFPFPNNRHQDILLFFKGYVCHLLNLKRNQLNRQVAMEFRGQKTQVSSPSTDPMDQMKTTSEILRVVNGYQLPVFQSTIGCKICVKNWCMQSKYQKMMMLRRGRNMSFALHRGDPTNENSTDWKWIGIEGAHSSDLA